jgi:hypothetical protein
VDDAHRFFVQPPRHFSDGELTPDKLRVIPEEELSGHFKRSISLEMDRRKGQASQGSHQDALLYCSGIITMEDVLEELIQAEIMDETDIYEDNSMQNKVKRGVREISEMEEREAFFRAMVGTKGYKEKTLSEEEMNAVVSFLCLHVEAFRKVTDLAVVDGRICDGEDGKVSLSRVREMLGVCPVEELDLGHHREVYTAGNQTDTCTLVLTGRLKIIAGVEGFMSEAGPFSVLAVGSLTSHKNRGSYHAAYVVDFTATVLERTRLLRIERRLYERMISGDQLAGNGRDGPGTSPSLLSRQPSTGVLRAEEAGAAQSRHFFSGIAIENCEIMTQV